MTCTHHYCRTNCKFQIKFYVSSLNFCNVDRKLVMHNIYSKWTFFFRPICHFFFMQSLWTYGECDVKTMAIYKCVVHLLAPQQRKQQPYVDCNCFMNEKWLYQTQLLAQTVRLIPWWIFVWMHIWTGASHFSVYIFFSLHRLKHIYILFFTDRACYIVFQVLHNNNIYIYIGRTYGRNAHKYIVGVVQLNEILRQRFFRLFHLP